MSAAAMMRKLAPLGNRVLVKRVVQEARTAGGILLPETGKKLNEGEVVAVGAGALTREGKLIPMNLKAGDKVLLPEYGGHSVKLGEEEFHIYVEEDILGRFEMK